MFRPLCRYATRQGSIPLRSAAIGTRSMHAPVTFDWTDPLNAKSLFTDEEAAISETAEAYCQERMLPRVLGKLPV
jgi:glutaryl-CoA dehydrogenase